MKKRALQDLATLASKLDYEGAYKQASQIDHILKALAFAPEQIPPDMQAYVKMLRDPHVDLNIAVQAFLALKNHGVDVATGHLEELGIHRSVITAIKKNFNDIENIK